MIFRESVTRRTCSQERAETRGTLRRFLMQPGTETWQGWQSRSRDCVVMSETAAWVPSPSLHFMRYRVVLPDLDFSPSRIWASVTGRCPNLRRDREENRAPAK